MTGIGAGFFYSSVTTAAVTALDPSRASLAGGLIYMFQIAGGAIGLGITTTIFTLSSENELADKADAAGTQLTDHQTAVLHGVLAGTDSGTAALHQLGSSAQATITTIVRESFATGHPGRLQVRGDRRRARLPDLALLRRRPAASPARPRGPSEAQA